MNTVTHHTADTIATWFHVGHLKKVPGTFGTLAALPFAFFVQEMFGNHALFFFSLALFGMGCWACEVYQSYTGTQDSPEIVIDEVAGICFLLSVLYPTWQSYLTAFILFRFFDIVKPWPVSWFDRNVDGAFGVMIDDIAAAFYPIFIMLVCISISMALGKTDLFTPIMSWLSGL